MADIQWYPGHMAKAKRQFQEKLKLVDVVLELVDARIPYSSINPDLDEIIGDKPRVKILMKADLADPSRTKQWLSYFKEQNIEAVTFNAKKNFGMDVLLDHVQIVLQPYYEKLEEKGLQERAIRAVMVGIPNVGKSTLINRFAGKNIAQTGNKPGMTRAQQWIKYKNKLELLDTPGILWPKFEDQEVGKRLALIGSIKDRLLYLDDIVLYGMDYLAENYPGALAERYKFDEQLEQEMSMPDLLLLITEKRGFIDDYSRAAEMMIHEIRNGIVGRFTFEFPEDINDGEE